MNSIDPDGLQGAVERGRRRMPVAPIPIIKLTPQQWQDVKDFLRLFDPRPLADYLMNRSGQERDPVSHKPFNPGRDCNGNCNPCPPNEYWEAPGNRHGSTSGTHWHGIEWNQDQTDCMCYPKRVSGPTRDRLK